MPSETDNKFFIPVGRRYEDTRAALANRLETGTAEYEGDTITWVDSGYAGDDECIQVMTPDGERNHARSALCRPGTAFDRVVLVTANDFVGVNVEPDNWETDFECVIEMLGSATVNHCIATNETEFNMGTNIVYDDTNNRWEWQATGAWGLRYSHTANAMQLDVTGASTAGALIDWTAATVNRYLHSSTGTLGDVFNLNNGDFDFSCRGVNENFAIYMEAEVDCVGMGTNEPLLNIGSAAGDLNRATNRGLHILGDDDAGDHVYLILEGQGDAGNGDAGADAAHFIFSATGCINANQRNMEIRTSDVRTDILEFRSLNDDLTERIGDILNIEGSAGNVLMGTTTFDAACVRNLAIAEGTAPGGATADQCYIWAQDDTGTAEMYVQDGAGNQLKFSPHNEKGEWVFDSTNVETDRHVYIEMEKLIKDYDKRFKTDFFQESKPL